MLTETDLRTFMADTAGSIRAIDQMDCEISLSTFIKRAWSQLEPSTPYKHGWHMDAICDHLQAVHDGYINRLLINVPPGTSKSLSTSVFFPAWEWGPGGRPGTRFIGTSYSERFAMRDNNRTKHLLQSDWYQERWGDRVKLIKEGDKKIENTAFGFREAIPFKSLTGGRADRLICFPASTKIWTEAGPLEIGAVVNGRLAVRAWSLNPKTGRIELRKISAWHRNPAADVVKLTTADGSTLVCTKDHRILTKRGYVEAQDLRFGDLLCAASRRMFAAASVIVGAQLKVEMSPDAAGSDVVDHGRTDAELSGQNLGGVLVSGGDLTDQFLGQMRGTVLECAVPLAVGNVSGAGAVFEVAEPAVIADTILVPNLLASPTRANERLGNHLVDEAVELFALVQGDPRVALVGDGPHHAGRNAERLAFLQTNASDRPATTEVADLVQPLKVDDRSPFFTRLVGLDLDHGHAEETFCVTVDGNHNILCGEGEQIIVCSNCDDPHSTETAESQADRETTTRIFLESVPTRLNNPEKSAIIIIMQRLHEDDVSGIALSNDLGYTHLCLPMEHDPSRHCITYYPKTDRVLFEDPRTGDGELLFPDRFPKDVVENYKNGMGPYAYASQMQQTPVPRGGGIFQWDWWQMWGNPEYPEDPVFKRFPTCEYVVASLDSAYTEKTENDYSALTIWGIFRDAVPTISNASLGRRQQQMAGRPKIILMHAWQKRVPIRGPEPPPREDWENDYQYRQRCQKYWGLSEWVVDTCRRFKVDRLLIESKASGISVAQEIRSLHANESYGVQLVDPKQQDKVARAYSVQHLFSDSMVYAPDRDWADLVKGQMANFPKASHDDLTDSATQALRHLRDIGLAAHGFEVDAELHDAMIHRPEKITPLYPV